MRPDQLQMARGAQVPAFHGRPAVPLELSVLASSRAPAVARAAVTGWIHGRATANLLADALLVVGELVANSVRHADTPADSPIAIRAEARDGVLLLEVVDAGVTGAVAVRTPDLSDGGGFGLRVVDELTRRWGVERDGTEPGTRVWAEIAWA